MKMNELLYEKQCQGGCWIANSLSAIAAYCFLEKKPTIKVNFINDGLLTIF